MSPVTRRSRLLLVGTVSILVVAAIVVAIFVTTTARETPTDVATRALTALAEKDAKTLAAVIDGDDSFDAALTHVDAIEEPITDVRVEDVTAWTTEDGVDQARVTFQFSVGDSPVAGDLVAVREPGGITYVRFPVLVGELHLPTTPGGRAHLAGATDQAEVLSLLPGVYEITSGDDLPFPFALTGGEVAVTPGSRMTVAPERDEGAVRDVLEETAEAADADAERAAESALTDGSLPTDSATRFGRPGRGFHVISVTEAIPASFEDGVVTRRYTVVFAAEQYNGSLDQEWMPVEGSAAITVETPVDEVGAPATPRSSLDASDLAWGAAG